MIVFWSSFFYGYICVHYVILFLIAMFSLDKKMEAGTNAQDRSNYCKLQW